MKQVKQLRELARIAFAARNPHGGIQLSTISDSRELAWQLLRIALGVSGRTVTNRAIRSHGYDVIQIEIHWDELLPID